MGQREDILANIREIEVHLPRTRDELTHDIDRYIFGAQSGFDLCTDLLIHDYDRLAEASVAYKKALASALCEAQKQGVAATARKEWALPFIIAEDCDQAVTEYKVSTSRILRDRYLERLNTYKKIKGDNINMRGAG